MAFNQTNFKSTSYKHRNEQYLLLIRTTAEDQNYMLLTEIQTLSSVYSRFFQLFIKKSDYGQKLLVQHQSSYKDTMRPLVL